MLKSSSNIAIIAGERRVSFSEMLRKISLFAKHTPKGKGDKTIIMSENREGWIYAFYSIWANKGIAVPVDAGSTAHDVAYILNDCHPAAIWTSREKESVIRAALAETGLEMPVLLIDDFELQDASAEPEAVITYKDDDTCIICYTSGTTGSPKGVMLSFDNVNVNVSAVSDDVPIFTPDRRTIILLPLHHVLPLVGTIVMPMKVGGGVAICPSLSGPDIMDTLQRGQIAIMIGVPRLWQTLYRGIKAKIDAKGITRALFNFCAKCQNRTLSRLVFSSVRKKMGGHITFCVSGGAALDNETAVGLKTLGLDVLEGYGMTEAAPMISFTRPGDIIPGCVGLPIKHCEATVIDGELCARGRNIMQGYYNRQQETADIIDRDGWLHTGDLATIDAVGRITLTGRKKEIIVLSNGKNVNPVEIEEKIETYKEIVKEAAVTQDGDMLRVIIVPQELWSRGKTIAEMEEVIKKEVLQPYNASVANYKKLMSLFVFEGELPRTRMEKLQRYKLKEILGAPGKGVEGFEGFEGSEGQYSKRTKHSSLKNPQNPQNSQSPLLAEAGAEYHSIASFIESEKKIAVHPNDNIETDLAMDSLDKVSLQGFIEQSFGMEITTEELLRLGTVAKIAEHVTSLKTRMEVEDIDWGKLLGAKAPLNPPLKGDLPAESQGRGGAFLITLCRWFYALMFHVETRGLENIPTEGPTIIAPNHQSFLDAPLVANYLSAETFRNTYYYAKRDHVRGPIMRWLAVRNNIIIMDMRTLKDSIQTLGQVLKEGKNLVIFPEGTRSKTGEIGSFKKTFAILSKELGVPVVPVRISGAYEAWPRHRWFPRPHKITVEFLPAVSPTDEAYEIFADRVREIIVGK